MNGNGRIKPGARSSLPWRTIQHNHRPSRFRHVADSVDRRLAPYASVWIDSLQSAEIHLQLPKFRVEYEVDLVKPLTSMGMGIAFGGGADFGRMLPRSYVERPPVFIEKVFQCTFVDVNEAGTDAAAATMMAVADTASGPMPFVVDRPFVFIIRDDISRTVLFIGHIADPG